MCYITYFIDCNQFGNKDDEEIIAKSQSPNGCRNKLPIVNLETSKSDDVENLLTGTDSIVHHQPQSPDLFKTMTFQESTTVRLTADWFFFINCYFFKLKLKY